MTDLEYHPLSGIFELLEGEEFKSFTEDMAKGQQEPITMYEGMILDGRNRYRALKALGVEIEQMRFYEYTGDDPLGYVVSLNLARRHLNESQRAMAGAKIAQMRQGARTDIAQICATSQPQAAKLLNVSRRLIQYAKQVTEHGVPELIARVAQGDMSVYAAADIAKLPKEEQDKIILKQAKEIVQARAEANKQRRDDTRAQKIALIPEGQFRDIVEDPPWSVEGPHLVATPDGGAVDYPTMSVKEIREWNLKVLSDIAAPDCNLFLWTTQTFLRDAIVIVEECGFRYMGLFTWNKLTENGEPAGKQDPGFPMRNSEFVVYARKGSADFTETKGLRWCFDGVRQKQHSRKPTEFFNMIRAATSGPRVSLFDREAREGFVVGGNETGMFDEANRKVAAEQAESEELLRSLGLLDEAAE